jgi:hypothetical protein
MPNTINHFCMSQSLLLPVLSHGFVANKITLLNFVYRGSKYYCAAEKLCRYLLLTVEVPHTESNIWLHNASHKVPMYNKNTILTH